MGQAATSEPTNMRVRPGLALGMIGAGHFMSHAWTITLPSLFTVLAVVFGVDFLQLGLIITVTTITSAVCQMPVGYLVDRYGPKPLLVAGLLTMSAAYLLSAVAPSYEVLLVLGVAAGAGQSVFHPADYAILSALFSREKAGKPYSIHTFTGFAGSAVAPLALAGINHVFNWQVALATTGVLGLLIAISVALALHVPRIAPERPARSEVARQRGTGRERERRRIRPAGALSHVFTRPFLLIFAFFVFTSMFTTGLQSYLPSTLSKLYGSEPATANGMLTAFLATLSVGVLAGGFLADRIHNYARVIGATFGLGTLLMFVIAVLHLPIPILFPVFAIAGGLQGVVMPSRDKMVREAGPESAAGTSFAFVTLGMNLGSIIAVPIVGAILDHGQPGFVFWLLAIFLLVASVTVFVPTQARSASQPERSETRASI